jgi:hypothetical protein
MAAIEEAARSDETLVKQLSAINGRRDAGVHGLGEIWRRRRLSCPSREQLGSFLLGVLSKDHADYISFHLEAVECRCCGANIEDLRSQQSAAASEVSDRRRRYFQTSAGYLSKENG